jgi:dihydroorotate dehydrogenase (fumarate)
MSDLKTKYLGIDLKNPIVVGACNLVNEVDNIKHAEDAGAGAIVFKSLFEEQIQLESAQLDDELEEYNERHPEMIKLFPDVKHAGPEEHLVNLRKAKESVNIPIVASLNATYKESWVDYAQKIEETGIDALELNFYSVPRDFQMDGATVEAHQLDILKEVIAKVKVPVSVKLSPFYANPLNIIKEMDKVGVKGFVLFNRLFQPDVNVEDEEHYTPFNLSTPEDNRLPLRFAGLLHDEINADIISSTGIFSGKDVAKMILAGADSVQVVSALYKNKITHIASMLNELSAWMDSKGYKSLQDFRGKVSRNNLADPFIYKRAQYIDLLLKSEEVLKINKQR